MMFCYIHRSVPSPGVQQLMGGLHLQSQAGTGINSQLPCLQNAGIKESLPRAVLTLLRRQQEFKVYKNRRNTLLVPQNATHRDYTAQQSLPCTQAQRIGNKAKPGDGIHL